MNPIEASGARQPRGRAPLTTLAAGEYISIQLRDDRGQRVGQIGGTLVAADSVAIRLEAEWLRRGMWPEPASGETIVPWSRVASIRVGGER